MKHITLLLLALYVSGCAVSSKRLNRLEVGMSRDQVFKELGDPDSTKSSPNETVYEYKMVSSDWATHADAYWVVMRDGKVSTFGKAGDFNTLAAPTQNINLNTTSH